MVEYFCQLKPWGVGPGVLRGREGAKNTQNPFNVVYERPFFYRNLILMAGKNGPMDIVDTFILIVVKKPKSIVPDGQCETLTITM